MPKVNFPSVNTGNSWDPAALEREEQHVQSTLLRGYQDALTQRGVSEQKMARMRTQQLRATKTQLVKIKGALPPQLKLPRGYRVITPTERVTVKDPTTGQEIVADPGETIIEQVGPDWATREKAMSAIEEIMGYRKPEEQESDGRTVVVVNSLVPLPAAPPSEDALALVHQCISVAQGGNGSNGGGNGQR